MRFVTPRAVREPKQHRRIRFARTPQLHAARRRPRAPTQHMQKRRVEIIQRKTDRLAELQQDLVRYIIPRTTSSEGTQ